MATFSWAAVIQAISLYFSYKNRKKGEEGQGDVVGPPAPKPEPVPVPVPEPKPVPEPAPVGDIIDCDYKDIIHHYNPKSFEDSAHPGGQGVSILFCVGDHYSAVSLNGAPMRLHNSNDEGRDAWTTVDFRTKKPTFVSGTVVAKHKNGKTYRFNLPAGGKSYLDYKGYCFGKR